MSTKKTLVCPSCGKTRKVRINDDTYFLDPSDEDYDKIEKGKGDEWRECEECWKLICPLCWLEETASDLLGHLCPKIICKKCLEAIEQEFAYPRQRRRLRGGIPVKAVPPKRRPPKNPIYYWEKRGDEPHKRDDHNYENYDPSNIWTEPDYREETRGQGNTRGLAEHRDYEEALNYEEETDGFVEKETSEKAESYEYTYTEEPENYGFNLGSDYQNKEVNYSNEIEGEEFVLQNEPETIDYLQDEPELDFTLSSEPESIDNDPMSISNPESVNSNPFSDPFQELKEKKPLEEEWLPDPPFKPEDFGW